MRQFYVSTFGKLTFGKDEQSKAYNTFEGLETLSIEAAGKEERQAAGSTRVQCRRTISRGAGMPQLFYRYSSANYSTLDKGDKY